MRLTDCFMDVVAYVSYCLKSENIPSFDQVRADILRLVGESEQRFEKGSFTRDDYDLARFAVCAWVDESLIGSSWSDKGQWLKEPLQRIYYQTSDAGELFFQRLNTLGPHQQHVREVYYLCLALGFSGQYCNEGDEFLIDQLKISNLKLLTGSSVGLPSLSREDLFPDAYPGPIDVELPQTKAEKKFSLLTLASVGVPFILFLVLFVIYRFVLSSIGDNIISTVQ
jgi:type VI secretion system protein ImpK